MGPGTLYLLTEIVFYKFLKSISSVFYLRLCNDSGHVETLSVDDVAAVHVAHVADTLSHFLMKI